MAQDESKMAANDECSKCGGTSDLTDIKISNDDLGKLCSTCHKKFQDSLKTHFKSFITKTLK